MNYCFMYDGIVLVFHNDRYDHCWDKQFTIENW
jgi:hypothetical protein